MNISIKKPCHEDWSKMAPNEQGAFCKVCTKDVVDFSKKTLDEIKSYFSKPRDGKTCGRFNNDQLDALNFDSFFERFTGFKLTRKVALVIAVTFMSWFMGGPLSAQDEKVKGEVAMRPQSVAQKDTTKTAHYNNTKTAGTVSIQKDPKTTRTEKAKADEEAKKKAVAEAAAKRKAQSKAKQTKDPKPHLLGDVDINYDESKKDEKKN